MYKNGLHQHIEQYLDESLSPHENDTAFRNTFLEHAPVIFDLYLQLYEHHPRAEHCFGELIEVITRAHIERPASLQTRDAQKKKTGQWFLSNTITGMSLYVDRFCGTLPSLQGKLSYFERLGVNFLHLMPLFASPANESDGGYAVSDFRTLDARFGNLDQLRALQMNMQDKDMYLMLDIVLNHTSRQHEWAQRARNGEQEYQDYFYFYTDRSLPDRYDQSMPDIFPESAPGNFTYIPECDKWVMTVFHDYQWDLNYTNPKVFIEMLDIIFFYANLGVDILRIDAPAFIWKQIDSTCQNLPQAHTILRLIRQCVDIAAPGMALLGEAIVAPKDIMPYFGTGEFTARECSLAYNATQMALSWDMLATADTRVMLSAQSLLAAKPIGSTWVTYTRCHDDIGLGYEDYMIGQAGFDALAHRRFLKEYYSGQYPDSPARGALFSNNPRTGDARISGSLASLCGLERALEKGDKNAIGLSIQKILLMQAHSFFLGGIPMLFYGDETGQVNDYSYLQDPGKNYDNRWMHRPLINWSKLAQIDLEGSTEQRVFSGTQRLIQLRKNIPAIADFGNIKWLGAHNKHVTGYLRAKDEQQVITLFNFGKHEAFLTWFALRELGVNPTILFDHWEEQSLLMGTDAEYLILAPYQFMILEADAHQD